MVFATVLPGRLFDPFASRGETASSPEAADIDGHTPKYKRIRIVGARAPCGARTGVALLPGGTTARGTSTVKKNSHWLRAQTGLPSINRDAQLLAERRLDGAKDDVAAGFLP